MLASVIPYLRCPTCASTPMRSDGRGVSCLSCSAGYRLRGGILDMAGTDCRESITPFQRLMQSALVVSVYEAFWRRVGYFLASSRSFDKEMVSVLGLSRGKDTSRVLDLACGPGIFTRPLAARSHGVVVGLDLSWPMLRHAKRLVEKKRIDNVVLIRASAFRIPFMDGTFSYINCCGALHLFDRPEKALGEIDRVLMSRGHLAIQTTLRPAHSAGFAYFLERVIRFGFFDKTELDQALRNHNIEILQSERHRISYTFLGRHIS